MRKKILIFLSVLLAVVFIAVAVFLVAHRGFIVSGQFSFPAADIIITAMIAGAVVCLIFVLLIIWIKQKT